MAYSWLNHTKRLGLLQGFLELGLSRKQISSIRKGISKETIAG
jgi:hypothetical protein